MNTATSKMLLLESGNVSIVGKFGPREILTARHYKIL